MGIISQSNYILIEYLRSVGEKHRKRYGQFFTHSEVAEFMVRWVLKSGQRALFDPAFGLGAFCDPIADDPSIVFAGARKIPKFSTFGQGERNDRKWRLLMKTICSRGGNRTPILSVIRLTCASKSLLAEILCSRRLSIIWA